jgi:hypothetical protein
METGNICSTCSSGKEPNSDKNDCKTCEDGKYSNTLTQSVCDVCSPGFKPTEKQNDCVGCETGTYSNPAGGLLCAPCESIKYLDFCKSVRGISLEECFWIENDESESKGYCVAKV